MSSNRYIANGLRQDALTLVLPLAVSWLAAGVSVPTAALAHGGGLNADGCHHDRKNGGYHCHRAPSRQPARPAPLPESPRLISGSADTFSKLDRS